MISVPWVTTAMFAPAPVPIRYAMAAAATAAAIGPRAQMGGAMLWEIVVASVLMVSSLVVDSSSSLRVGQAPGCQFEAASQDGRSRASGTSPRVASKSAW